MLKRLGRRLEGWRASRKGQWGRIPEEIWQEAVQAAERYGVGLVAKRLGLDYKGLKTRVGGSKGIEGRKEGPPAFVELLSPLGKRDKTNSIEVQTARGSRLRIEFEGEITKQLSVLSEKLWRAAR